MQVTYLEAFLQIQNFEPAGTAAFLGWLRRIAANNLRDAIRGLERLKRPPPSPQFHGTDGSASVVGLFDALGFTTTTPSRVAAVDEMKSALEQALAELPEDYANAIRLYDLEGRPIAEAAQCMRRSPGAFHMLRARAQEQLRALLGPASKYFSQTA
jgi:RNA polymerase sigma factor (sigma-70 family)